MKRRNFIKSTACAGMGTSTLISGLLNMKSVGAAAMSNSAVVNSGDYKALVCIMLGGGNDSFNTLIPRSGQGYTDYANARSNNAISSSSIINLNPLNTQEFDLGLHPSLPNLANLFHQGKAAFISNIGTLIERMTVNDFYNNSKRIPLGLYSHSDQIQQWQTGLPQDRSGIGWGGRMAELEMIMDMNNNQKVSMNVSLSGNNFIQTGSLTVPYTLIPDEGPAGLNGIQDTEGFQRWKTKAIRGMLDTNYEDVFEKTFVNTFKSSLDAFDLYKGAFEQTSGTLSHINFVGDEWAFGQSLKTIADTIAARNILDQQRQTFFVEFGGWDHHDELVNSHAEQLYAVDQGIKSFQDAIDSMGLGDQVVTFVISEFGRPLVSNGNGTDHAWGGNVFVVGNQVNGQRVYGRYPRLSLNNPDDYDIGGGIFLPELSCDEYFAELAMWFGVNNNADLETILPNIRNFYASGSSTAPIGFLL